MPKQIRWAIRQSLTSVMNYLTKAILTLTSVGKMYETDHPDYYEAYCEIAAGLQQIKDAVQKMYDNT